MAETLKLPTRLELRDEFIDMVYRNLLSPAGDPEEQVREATVRSRYIVGMLTPNNHSPIPTALDEMGNLAVDGDADSQDGKPDRGVSKMGGAHGNAG